MKKTTTEKIARAGVISAVYVVLSLITLPISSGFLQIRIAEALTLLPLIYAECVPALFIGCIISNLIAGCTVLDIIFGSLITLVAGVLTCLIGKVIKGKALKIFVGGLFPVFLNAFLLPVIWYFCYGKLEYVYMLQVLFLAVGQSASVYLLGSLFYSAILKQKEKQETFVK